MSELPEPQGSQQVRPDPRSALEVEALRREVERLRAQAQDGGGLLEAVLEHSPHGITVCDANGKLVLQNRASERIWAGSVTADGVEGWAGYRAFHPDGRAYRPEDWSMARCLRTGTVVEPEEVRFQRFDGSMGVLLASCAPILGPNGRVEGAITIFADISRFKDLTSPAADRRGTRETELLYLLADAANRADRPDEVFEPALEAITEGLRVARASILLFDPDGVMRFKAWRGLSEAYRTAVEGHSPWTRDTPDPKPILVHDAFEDPELRAYGPLFSAEGIRGLAFVPLVHQGRLFGKFMVYSPTARTLTPAEVRFAATIASHVSQAVARSRLHAEAEAASRAKDEFISLLGHELRNPLSPIVTALHLMRMSHSDAFARERAVIERQVKHLGRLVDDLLDVSRIARGLVELRKGTVQVPQVVQKAVDMAAPLLEERGHRLEVRVPSDLTVHADEARLAQVLGNLVHNAAKFTDPGGHIRVSARELDGDLEIVVQDEGCGIAPELLPRVFDLFSHGRPSHTSSKGGLGLGLSIVRSLVEQHGGKVEARSEGLGRGAEFVVRLPRTAQLPPVQQPVRTPKRGAWSPRRVLVVDDNVDAANLLAEALRQVGHEVRCAYDGPSALRAAEKFQPEIGLLDLGLPVMDGYELAERLSTLPFLEGIRLVAVTGYGQAADRQRALRRGFAEHFTKPVDLESLLELVDRWRP